MVTRSTLLIAMLISLVILCIVRAPAQVVKSPGIEGTWQGTVTNGSQTARFVMRIEKKGDSYSGTFLLPDLSADTMPLTMLTYKDGSLQFAFSGLGIKWEGKLEPATSRLVGTASDASTKYPLNFTSYTDNHGPVRPQEPKEPYPYTVQEVEFTNGPGRVALSGTITLPKSPTAGAFPAVVLLSGLGHLDRDGENYGHKPFLVIADCLTRRGIAVLRVDDRGIGKSEGEAGSATIADFATDLSAAVGYLKSRSDIGKVGVIGYGTGGAIAPICASRSTSVGFVIMMGAPAIDGRRVLAAQTDLMVEESGATVEEVNMIRRFQARAFGIMIAAKDPEAASSALVSAMTDEIAKLPVGRRVAWLKMMSAMTRNYNTPWMRYFTGFDPTPYLKALNCPALVMYGETDQEVQAMLNLQAMELALQQSRTKDYKVQIETGLNHLFQSSKSGDSAEYDRIAETIAPVVLKSLGDWIAEHAK